MAARIRKRTEYDRLYDEQYRKKFRKERLEYGLKYKEENRLSLRDSCREYRLKNSDKVSEYQKNYSIIFAKKKKARRLLRSAVERGVLVKPTTCERCGKTPNTGSDGRSMLQGHHANYNKALEVSWWCVACHALERRARGEKGKE